MCGIVGFNWQDREQVIRLADMLRHRGPEQEGFHTADGVSLGHKRLCIIDLSANGTQPLYNEDRSICIVYNGEIFNFPEIKKELEHLGHRFASHTDTEVLVHGYEQWGQGIVKRLNGQFAFCIFDRNRNLFFLARDHFGIKPLYYYAGGDKFIFGSELKVLLKSGIDRDIDRFSLDHYMLFGYMPVGRTILNSVRQLAPACFLIYDLGQRRITSLEKYWQLSFDNKISVKDSERDIEHQLVELLERSVKRQLISDVPVGAFLSGGVDSSIIVALMRRHVEKLRTFSIRFDYPDFNESQYAKIVSDRFGTEHHEIEFNAENVRELIRRLPCYYDEPFADPSMIPTCLVSSVAKEHVTVSLSGTGGDELFAGYPRYSEFGILKKLNSLPALFKGLLDSCLGCTNAFPGWDKLNKLRCFLDQPLDDHILYMMLLSYMFRDRSESVEKLKPYSDLREYFWRRDDLKNLMNFDIHHYLPNCLLVKEDRASMAVSLEVRVPFLDYEFAEFAAGIPSRLKIHHGNRKYILKNAFRDMLPAAILHRRKQGFGVPLVHYFRNELKQFAYDLIFGSARTDFFDKNMLENLWMRHQSGKSDYSRILWSVIMFNLWHDRWLK